MKTEDLLRQVLQREKEYGQSIASKRRAGWSDQCPELAGLIEAHDAICNDIERVECLLEEVLDNYEIPSIGMMV
jgi:hypothetical protein